MVVDIEGKSKKGGYTEFDQQKKLLEFPEKKVDPMTISLEVEE